MTVVPSAIVVGGGLAGMTVARELALRGWRIKLLERSGRLGGKAGSDLRNGRMVEHGYHLFPQRYPNGRAIVHHWCSISRLRPLSFLGPRAVSEKDHGPWALRGSGRSFTIRSRVSCPRRVNAGRVAVQPGLRPRRGICVSRARSASCVARTCENSEAFERCASRHRVNDVWSHVDKAAGRNLHCLAFNRECRLTSKDLNRRGHGSGVCCDFVPLRKTEQNDLRILIVQERTADHSCDGMFVNFGQQVRAEGERLLTGTAELGPAGKGRQPFHPTKVAKTLANCL